MAVVSRGAAGRQTGQTHKDPQFFVESHREVNELHLLLQRADADRDVHKKREAVQKVISCMTMGIDVSRIFSDMVMSSATSDLVTKKMVYLYLTTYAGSHPDMAILVINTLRKDCSDVDPAVRGLALRSLSNLKVLHLAEYLRPAVRDSLEDSSAYVRRAAVTAAVKLYHLVGRCYSSEEKKTWEGLLRERLMDDDPDVVVSALTAINELLADEGGLTVDAAQAHMLLNNLQVMSPWGQCVVLEMMTSYSPESEEEVFDIMNVLENCLHTNSAAVVMGITKLFLFFTHAHVTLHTQILSRLKTPLLTFISTASSEEAFTIIQHLKLLLGRGPDPQCHVNVLRDDFATFFVRFGEPGYLKKAKLELLGIIVSESNVEAIIDETCDVIVCELDNDVRREATRLLGVIANKIPTWQDAVTDKLLEFLSTDMPELTRAVLPVLRDVLRDVPQLATSVVRSPLVTGVVRRMIAGQQKAEGRNEELAAVLWILGRFGNQMDNAPYHLEDAVNLLVEGDERLRSATVLVPLIDATARLFILRPPEMQRTFGRLLVWMFSTEAVSVHFVARDRALFIHRLFSTSGPDGAKKILFANLEPRNLLASGVSFSDREALFQEFNTLSVVIGRSSREFLRKDDSVISQSGKYVGPPRVLCPEAETVTRQEAAGKRADAALLDTTGSVNPPYASGALTTGSLLDEDVITETPQQTASSTKEQIPSTGQPADEVQSDDQSEVSDLL